MPTHTIDTSGKRHQRADARRNVSAIMEAATACLERDSAVSLADIAGEAGVGRITVYGHFRTRADLVGAVFEQTMSRANTVLDEVELSDDSAEALATLVGASWRVVEQFRMILRAAQRELPAERIRLAHDRVIKRLAAIVERGRSEGVFRSDLPSDWLVAVVLSLIHASAEEVEAGRAESDQVSRYLVTTLLAAFAPRPPEHD